MPESHQKKLDRVRPPRVQISYDVETNGAMEKKELPFVVGVLADLSAQRKDPLPPVKDRKFTEIDRDNINDVMAEAAPALQLSVPNTLADDGSQLRVGLEFKSMDDFEPARVAEQVAPLKELLDMRKRLDEVLAKISTNQQLEGLLQDVLANTDKVKDLAKQMGIEGDGDAPAKTEGGE
ncbi:MAG TPA: type VI secretion system contractile sheath small subunit [Fimbriiglobus sp.]|jgi:type VI secretion system protein ImpB